MPEEEPPLETVFDGFEAPRYTPTPDILFDVLLPYLSGAELKVLLYIVRRTFGFKKDADAISLKQLTHGITTRDGRRLDRGTGMPASSVIRARDSLLARHVILAEKHTGPDGGDETTTYRLRMRGDILGSHHASSPDLQNATPPTSIMEPPGLVPRNPQETGQETAKQEGLAPEFSSREPSPAAPYSPYIAGVVLDHARELDAERRGAAAVPEVLGWWVASGQSEAAVVAQLHAARAAVRQQQRPGADKWRLYLETVRKLPQTGA